MLTNPDVRNRRLWTVVRILLVHVAFAEKATYLPSHPLQGRTEIAQTRKVLFEIFGILLSPSSVDHDCEVTLIAMGKSHLEGILQRYTYENGAGDTVRGAAFVVLDKNGSFSKH